MAARRPRLLDVLRFIPLGILFLLLVIQLMTPPRLLQPGAQKPAPPQGKQTANSWFTQLPHLPSFGGNTLKVALPVSNEPFSRTSEKVLQDGEFVYGPALKGFDTASFLAQHPQSVLVTYSEVTTGGQRTAANLIDYVAMHYSISPKLLLAFLELENGWILQPATGNQPPSNLINRVGMMSAWLADGYYGMKYRGTTDLEFADGSRKQGPTEGGAAHYGVARYLARGNSASELPSRLQAFATTYDQLFGQAMVVANPIPEGLQQPPFLLPWEEGQRWHYTGGPHGAWGIATAWGAVDFAPPTMVGCRSAPEWNIAVMPGVVLWSEDGLVLQDTDGDNFLGTGWVPAYLHMGTEGRVPVGTVLEAGSPVGHPSCEGGVADGAHIHFTRRYNGEWLPADGGPAPLNLSGWTFTSYGSEYDGSMQHPSQGTRMAVTSRRPGETEVQSDNGPTLRAEHAAAWEALQTGEGYTVAQIPSNPQPISVPLEEAPAPAAHVALPESGNTLAFRIPVMDGAGEESPVIIGLQQVDGDPSVLMSSVNSLGEGMVSLPDSVTGTYQSVVVRYADPCLQPFGNRENIELGNGLTTIDLSLGGTAQVENSCWWPTRLRKQFGN